MSAPTPADALAALLGAMRLFDDAVVQDLARGLDGELAAALSRCNGALLARAGELRRLRESDRARRVDVLARVAQDVGDAFRSLSFEARGEAPPSLRSWSVCAAQHAENALRRLRGGM